MSQCEPSLSGLHDFIDQADPSAPQFPPLFSPSLHTPRDPAPLNDPLDPPTASFPASSSLSPSPFATSSTRALTRRPSPSTPASTPPFHSKPWPFSEDCLAGSIADPCCSAPSQSSELCSMDTSTSEPIPRVAIRSLMPSFPPVERTSPVFSR